MDSDGIIICVPTPSNSDGSCDDSIVKEILAMCDYRTKIRLQPTNQIIFNIMIQM